MDIRNSLGILSSEIPTGNLLWVDQVNGNDSLAVRGQRGVPFQTLTAAKNAAKPAVFAAGELVEAGDTIMVLPGLYDEKDLLKHGVNWYFFPGAVVNNTAAGAIFGTGSSDIIASIAGFGEFNTDASAVVSVSAGGADLFIQARRMRSPDSSCVSVSAGSGTLKLQVAEKIPHVGDVVSAGEGPGGLLRDTVIAQDEGSVRPAKPPSKEQAGQARGIENSGQEVLHQLFRPHVQAPPRGGS